MVAATAIGSAVQFDMPGSFMLYLFEEEMKKTGRMSKSNGVHLKKSIARVWAKFFCAAMPFLVLLGTIFIVSCGHPSKGPEEEMLFTVRETAGDPSVKPVSESKGTILAPDNSVQDVDFLKTALEQTQSENALLKEENNRLRSEVIRLNQALADANQAIYTLNRKLDAIFKPDVAKE